jgi:hypothetical protein
VRPWRDRTSVTGAIPPMKTAGSMRCPWSGCVLFVCRREVVVWRAADAAGVRSHRAIATARSRHAPASTQNDHRRDAQRLRAGRVRHARAGAAGPALPRRSAETSIPVGSPSQAARVAAALAQEKYYSSYVTAPAQDLRSPDTRDAALIAQGLKEQPTTATPVIDRTKAPVAVEAPKSEFDWIDAAIGAAGALGVVLLTTGTMLAVRRRSHRDQPVAA